MKQIFSTTPGSAALQAGRSRTQGVKAGGTTGRSNNATPATATDSTVISPRGPQNDGNDKIDKSAEPATTAEKKAVVNGTNSFACELFSRVAAGKTGNLCLYPGTVATGLTQAMAGARGSTASQMAAALHLDKLPADRAQVAMGDVLDDVKAQSDITPDCQVRTASRVWTQAGMAVQPDFNRVTSENYHAEAGSVDFAGNTESARGDINAWVKKSTDDQIEELIPKGVLNANTRFVLTPVSTFKGLWETPFPPAAPGRFTTGSGNEVVAALMSRKGNFNYGTVRTGDANAGSCLRPQLDHGFAPAPDDVQVLELPFKGQGMSLVVLLPSDQKALDRLQSELTPAKLASWTSQMEPQTVSVTVPKFKVGSSLSLGDTLQAMGMEDAFNDNADFSGINGGRDLSLSHVIHCGVFEADEEKAQGAGATAVIGQTRSISRDPIFRADHPFVFVLRNNVSGAIEAMGRVDDPTQAP
jgi:serpin B